MHMIKLQYAKDLQNGYCIGMIVECCIYDEELWNTMLVVLYLVQIM